MKQLYKLFACTLFAAGACVGAAAQQLPFNESDTYFVKVGNPADGKNGYIHYNPEGHYFDLVTSKWEADPVHFNIAGNEFQLVYIGDGSVTLGADNSDNGTRPGAAEGNGMKFLLRGLYAHNGLLYFHTRMENGTNMPYSVDFITFKVVDKKMAKRTAIQEQVLQPLRAYHQVMQVRGMSSEHAVFALEQFSLAEDKQLEVTLYERNGGRTLTFYVTAEDLQLAKKIDNLKLKW